MTEWLRINVVVSEANMAAGNAFALAVGNGPGDARTFRRASYEYVDGGGKCSVASIQIHPEFLQRATTLLTAPDHASDMDMTPAHKMQAALDQYGPKNLVKATPDKLWVEVSHDIEGALANAGVRQFEDETLDVVSVKGKEKRV